MAPVAEAASHASSSACSSRTRGWPGRRMDHRLRLGSVERASSMEAHSRLGEYPARLRNDDVDDRGRIVGEPPEPQCGAMTRRGISPGVQQRSPHPSVRGDRAGEGRVHTGQDAPPSAGADMSPCLHRADAQRKELPAGHHSRPSIGDRTPVDPRQGGGGDHAEIVTVGRCPANKLSTTPTHTVGIAGIFSAPAPQPVEQLHLLEMIIERVIYPRAGSAG